MALSKHTLAEENNFNKFYEFYKDELRTETDTLNQRVIWSIFAQAGLIAAYAAVLNAPKEAKNLMYAHQQDVMMWVLPVSSLLLAAFTLPVIWASMVYMRELRQTYAEIAKQPPEGLPPLMGRPRSDWLTKVAELTPLIIPLIVVIAWVGIFVTQTLMVLKTF